MKCERTDVVFIPDHPKVWKLTPPQFKLYLHYRLVTNDGQHTCEEVVRVTAEESGLSVGTISRARDQLEEMGLLATTRVLFTGRGGNRVLVDLDDQWWEQDIRRKLREAGLSEDLISEGETPEG
jgi:DNA-binding MarR family transcriptional regulator